MILFADWNLPVITANPVLFLLLGTALIALAKLCFRRSAQRTQHAD